MEFKIVKKFCCILLLVSYMVPSVGVGVNLHWCGHILFAVSMDSDVHQDCLCIQFKDVGDETKPDCCKDDYVYCKLSQQHTASEIFRLHHFDKSPVINFINSFPPFSLFYFAKQSKVYFFAGYNTDESPPDLLKLGILRV